jgi:hypothetical protein
MKLNRNKLRKVLLQEMMAMSGGNKPQPGTPEYDYTAQIIQQVIMSCIQRGTCDPMQVNMMCEEMCADYGCPQFASYCTQRVTTMCLQMGL